MYYNKLLMLVFILFLSLPVLSQDDSTTTEKDWKWHWSWNEWDDWEMDFGFSGNHPAISLQYGLADLDRDDLQISVC